MREEDPGQSEFQGAFHRPKGRRVKEDPSQHQYKAEVEFMGHMSLHLLNLRLIQDYWREILEEKYRVI